MDTIGKRAIWIATAVISFQLFVPPIIGLANNADFDTVLRVLHLAPVDDANPGRYFAYIVQTWKPHPGPLHDTGLLTSEAILLWPAYALNEYVFSKDGLFDLRWTGLTHGALFVLALWLIAPVLGRLRPKPRIFLWAITLFFFLDVEYVSWFNSMYADAASLVLLFLIVALFVRLTAREGNQKWNQIGFLICLGLFLTSKAQHAVLGVPLFALLFWKQDLFGLTARRWLNWTLAGVAALAFGFMIGATPKRYPYTALYNVIFFNLLPHSSQPEAVLTELGLDPAWVRYRGTHAYSPEGAFSDGAASPEFMQRTSPVRLGVFYLRHPATAVWMWQEGFARSGVRRPEHFGNFPDNTGYPPGAAAESVALSSKLKSALMERRPGTALLYLVLGGAILCFSLGRSADRRQALAGACILILMALMEMVFSSMGDVIETDRHLFFYNALADVIFVSAVAAVTVRLTRKGSLPDSQEIEPATANRTASRGNAAHVVRSKKR